jgi:hypothetical protein
MSKSKKKTEKEKNTKKVVNKKTKSLANFKTLYKVKKKIKNYKVLVNKYIFLEDVITTRENVRYCKLAYNEQNYKTKLISKKKYVVSLKGCESVIITIPSAMDVSSIMEKTGGIIVNSMYTKSNAMGNTLKGIRMSFKKFENLITTDEGKAIVNFATDIDRHGVCLMSTDNRPIAYILA